MGYTTFILTLALTTASSAVLWGTGLGSADAAERLSLDESVPSAASSERTLETLETRRGEDGRLHITAKINGLSHDMMVDTAATHTVLNEQTAKAAHATLIGETRVITAGGYAIAQKATVKQLQIGSQTFVDQEVLIMDSVPVSLLGMDVLKDLEGRYLAL